MGECEFSGTCPFYNGTMANMPGDAEEMKEKYCENNNLNCARFMLYQAMGESGAPDDLKPSDKTRAYQLIAEG